MRAPELIHGFCRSLRLLVGLELPLDWRHESRLPVPPRWVLASPCTQVPSVVGSRQITQDISSGSDMSVALISSWKTAALKASPPCRWHTSWRKTGIVVDDHVGGTRAVSVLWASQPQAELTILLPIFLSPSLGRAPHSPLISPPVIQTNSPLPLASSSLLDALIFKIWSPSGLSKFIPTFTAPAHCLFSSPFNIPPIVKWFPNWLLQVL